MTGMDALSSTRDFWDANPCGAHGRYEVVRAQRYGTEPWLPATLSRIAQHRTILEVGCGQGVDSTILCAHMPTGGKYVGVDLSPASVRRAQEHSATLPLRVRPVYQVGNAERLAFESSSFDAVYSFGVIHHTAKPATAIAEVHRVLRPGGMAYVGLYRRPSLKVGAAQLLRSIPGSRSVYLLLRQIGPSLGPLGTMLHECFGVPYMAWYSRAEILHLFNAFGVVRVTAQGQGLGRGYLWLVEARKTGRSNG